MQVPRCKLTCVMKLSRWFPKYNFSDLASFTPFLRTERPVNMNCSLLRKDRLKNIIPAEKIFFYNQSHVVIRRGGMLSVNIQSPVLDVGQLKYPSTEIRQRQNCVYDNLLCPGPRLPAFSRSRWLKSRRESAATNNLPQERSEFSSNMINTRYLLFPSPADPDLSQRIYAAHR